MAKKEMAKPLLGKESEIHQYDLQKITVGILGTGDFARSLAARLVCSGYSVIVGSRHPKRTASLFPTANEVTSQREAISKVNIIFIAVYREHYSTLSELRDVLTGKILVDVSNNMQLNVYDESNAEHLASLFPGCTVVKAFNVISAWALQFGARDGNKQVLICSDSQEARCIVAEMTRNMGFIPVDMGALSSAREIENLPLRLFPSWKIPVLLALALFVFFYIYNFIRKVIHPYLMKGQNTFYKIPIDLVNVTLPCVAFVMLSLVYLPGVLAAIFQLRNGTKYKCFPRWLDQWLQQRKQLGLLSFFCATLHAVYSLSLPMRRSARYNLLNDAYTQIKNDKDNAWVEEEVWRMEIYLFFGILAIGVLSLLAVTSLPSVAGSLNWREFSFIQSRLGYAALVISTLHTLTFGWCKAFESAQYKFYLPPTFTIALIVPCIVLLAKVYLFLPFVNRKLTQIRRGWEVNRQVKFHEAGDVSDFSDFNVENTSIV
ncbi:metalloreductase STEAP3-like isoform X1 [Carcharodon carcharias]|uniref:metalloreductase STEAP3-like isoform X1 n=1 Tax=Carcharodon carcharias TaxID=13397 RepID=UPI001B7E1681|nr:metalloreductase STEAP3-like isoform X1 [Carcharodon carcharias]XP_041056234.1 metalloreductase STEAP3-like isoform X1 [Carcharodon carcharias]XP_041056235.1 metalloreductase STEAP3-like isoform X1 [Carcharodon carcharias]XP_041056236.1 metalloreductase STEAP3-like isoform X1 [Carcharodon carcharias]XP_041056237.1 metalloreductase STEAP3-like isoform X1 [Carcharodon carcharias]XP_041056238.1 metalloreductase STEAP3-like isoform X1 [Carcharodon carcharias]XP_041056239.1 metalloreductase STE